MSYRTYQVLWAFIGWSVAAGCGGRSPMATQAVVAIDQNLGRLGAGDVEMARVSRSRLAMMPTFYLENRFGRTRRVTPNPATHYGPIFSAPTSATLSLSTLSASLGATPAMTMANWTSNADPQYDGHPGWYRIIFVDGTTVKSYVLNPSNGALTLCNSASADAASTGAIVMGSNGTDFYYISEYDEPVSHGELIKGYEPLACGGAQNISDIGSVGSDFPLMTPWVESINGTDFVYVVNTNGQIYYYDQNENVELYTSTNLSVTITQSYPVVFGGGLFIGDDSGRLHRVTLTDGVPGSDVSTPPQLRSGSKASAVFVDVTGSGSVYVSVGGSVWRCPALNLSSCQFMYNFPADSASAPNSNPTDENSAPTIDRFTDPQQTTLIYEAAKAGSDVYLRSEKFQDSDDGHVAGTDDFLESSVVSLRSPPVIAASIGALVGVDGNARYGQFEEGGIRAGIFASSGDSRGLLSDGHFVVFATSSGLTVNAARLNGKTCTNGVECVTGSCSSNQCAKLANGAACTLDYQCSLSCSTTCQ